jgi:GAF domain-containing protein
VLGDGTPCQTVGSMSDVSAVLRDTERLAALRRLVLVDTPPTEPFDRLTRMAARLLRAPVALLTLVDADRQWFKSHHGLTDPLATSHHSPLSYSLCQFAVASGEPLVVEDAADHPQFRHHAIVREYGVRAYAGSPLFSPTDTRSAHSASSTSNPGTGPTQTSPI